MKAIVWTKYGSPDGLQLQEVEKPKPNENEVLIKIHATTVTAGDCETRSLKFSPWLSLPMRLFMGIRKPTRRTILGQELAGEIEAVGSKVTQFKIGDRVFGTPGFNFGAYAEYTTLPETSEDTLLGIIPDNLTYEEAAAVTTGGLESLHFLRKADIQPGQHVLIIGAGGSIGTFGVQIAKYYGAEVTAIDSTEKLEMLCAIGADHVIDYTQEDFSKQGKTYDVIFDVIGTGSYSGVMRSLKENGSYLLANPRLPKMLRSVWTSLASSKKVYFAAASRDTEDLNFLIDLLQKETIKVVVGRHYPLEQTAEAHYYVETGQKIGNLIITVG